MVDEARGMNADVGRFSGSYLVYTNAIYQQVRMYFSSVFSITQQDVPL